MELGDLPLKVRGISLPFAAIWTPAIWSIQFAAFTRLPSGRPAVKDDHLLQNMLFSPVGFKGNLLWMNETRDSSPL